MCKFVKKNHHPLHHPYEVRGRGSVSEDGLLLNPRKGVDFECDGRGGGKGFGMGIEKDGVQTCLLGSQDVGAEIVAYHDGTLRLGSTDAECIMEELGGRFVGSRILAKDNGVEKIVQTAGFQLAVLHLVETVAAHVETIPSLLQVPHQFVGSRNHARFDGTRFEEEVADLVAQFH